MNLDEIRTNIDIVDNKIKQLFIERMNLAGQVASAKLQTGDSIYKPDREQIVINNRSVDVDKNILNNYVAFLKKTMLVSREYQYSLTAQANEVKVYDNTLDIVNDNSCRVTVNAVSSDVFFDKLKELKSSSLFVTGFDRNNKNEFVLETNNSLTTVSSPSSVLLIVDDANYFELIGGILSITADYNAKTTYISTSNNGCIIELNANIFNKDINSMLYMLLSEYNNISIIGSY